MRECDEPNVLSNRKPEEMRQTPDARRTPGAQAALAVVLTDEGKRAIHSMRVLCLQMERNETAYQARSSARGETGFWFGPLAFLPRLFEMWAPAGR